MLIFFFSLLLLFSFGLLYQAVGLFRDRGRYPPLGRMVQVEDTQLHIYELGHGNPPVVMEAGIAGTLLGWALVEKQIAEFTRAISYDRAGLGWSSRSRRPRTVENMNRELHALLATAGISGPFILAGHSFGGLLMRAYAHRFPEQVAGLVLVDPVGVETWVNTSEGDRKRLLHGAKLSRRGAILARFGIVRAALDLLASGGRRLPKLIGKTAAGRGSMVLERLVGQVRHLPPECTPFIRSHWSNSKSFIAMAEYLECLPASAQHVADLQIPSTIPVTILSAASSTESELRERERWAAESANGRHIQLQDCGHWIQIDRPEEFIDAVRRMIQSAPTGSH